MIEALIKATKTYLPNFDEKRVKDAFEFAKDAHDGQFRKNGDPYISHPLATAEILTSLHVDEDILVAALLHDVPEDTTRTLAEIESKFGKQVAFLVEGITKLSKVHYRNDMEERQIESLKKMFIHSAKDPRIILIKLADRLHNMRTMNAIAKPEKRERIARETLEILVPIANLLGTWELKNQLEDYCFKILHPEEFDEISTLVHRTEIKKKNILKKTLNKVTSLLETSGVKVSATEGRQKNVYSIYKKMLRTGKSFHEIHDLIGVRIIVEDVGSCYQTLGILHQAFTPKIGRLKDYIAIPKNNGYQSIHTTVFGLAGVITEFQVRTLDMHLENEYGIAAHYFYSEKKQKIMQKKFAKKYAWVQEILEMQRDIPNNKKFLEHLKLDVFEDRIFVFTPKGDVIDLPAGSNCIDFAYQIHSDVGMLATEANINGKRSLLSTKLKSGDTVLIVTSEESDGPQIDWLDGVHTTLARTRIKEFLREKDRTCVISQAEEILNQKLKVLGLGDIFELKKEQKIHALEKMKIDAWEDLLYDVGSGTTQSSEIIPLLFDQNEVLGAAKKPFYEDAYSNRNHQPLRGNPGIVHTVSIIVEGNNRIGFLRDLCNEIANLGVNVLGVESVPQGKCDSARIEFLVEIVDFKQYEVVVEAIRHVEGVFNVLKLQTPPLNPEEIIGFHKKL